MINYKAWNASNSRAIAKFHNAGIGLFGHNTFIHELIRGSVISNTISFDRSMNRTSSYSVIVPHDAGKHDRANPVIVQEGLKTVFGDAISD